MAKQSSTYHDLRRALDSHGCPVCRLGQRTARHYLDGLLFDSVNDPQRRQEFAHSFGFCPQHNRELLDFRGERLAVAILERAFLQEAQRRLQGSRAPRHSLLGQVRAAVGRPVPAAEPVVPPRGDCPVCQAQAETEQRALRELARHLAGDLDDLLQAAGGLCWDHLEQALVLCPDAACHERMVAVHGAAWETLIGHLSEFIRKRDYRFRHEPLSEEESVASERAIAVFSGLRRQDED